MITPIHCGPPGLESDSSAVRRPVWVTGGGVSELYRPLGASRKRECIKSALGRLFVRRMRGASIQPLIPATHFHIPDFLKGNGYELF